MSRSPRVLPSVLVLFVGGFALPLLSPASAQDADQLWADFAHYIRIASPELAGEAAAGLTEVDPGALLDAVEASDYNQPNRIFERAAGMDAIADVAADVQAKIQAARLERSREPERIEADIQKLNQGQRAFENATERLKAAGQFAAPQMLAALIDKEQADLHPAIARSMKQIGRPLVAPLSIALPKLGPVAQGQVARVLADIGYPQAMPALKRVVENDQTDPAARETAQEALATIASNSRVPADASAADLYLALGEGSYRTATQSPSALDTYDIETDTGVVWVYDPKLTVTGGPGLAPIVVPGEIVGDAAAMQSAESALSLNPDLDAALSLFITANLRRENRLPEGENDPSYSSDRQEPSFYAMVAGPERLHDVLATALDANDADLALDAIAALSATASLDALQPLVRGLGYPDRRVRFRSAEALAYAMPTESFENDYRVVPVLADAVRQSGTPVALVVSPSQDARNELLSALTGQGFQTLDAESVEAAAGLVANTPGVDLIVVRGERLAIAEAATSSKANYKLASTPIVALTDSNNQASLASTFEDDPRVSVVLADEATLTAAIEQGTAGYSGSSLDEDVSTAYALSALTLLREIATADTAYNVTDALPALIAGVEDSRAEVAVASGDVLSRIDDPTAQAALAAAAIGGTGDTQIAHLTDLAESANAHGNLISAAMSDDILSLVKTSEGPTAVAAAQAHGALALPTRNAVDLILGE